MALCSSKFEIGKRYIALHAILSRMHPARAVVLQNLYNITLNVMVQRDQGRHQGYSAASGKS